MNKGRKLDKVEQKSRKQKLDEVGSETRGVQSMPCNTQGAKARGDLSEMKSLRAHKY